LKEKEVDKRIIKWVAEEMEKFVGYSNVETPTSFVKEEIDTVTITESDWVIITLKDGRKLGYGHGLLNNRELDELGSWIMEKRRKEG
jgi:hypothetical protein